jgi:regulator of chromosome condensation
MKLRTKSTLNISLKKSPIKKAGSKYSKIKKSFKRPEMKNTQIGQVFVVGSGDCAQLGLGPDVFEKAKFAKLSFFDELEVVDVVAGGLHNMALCKNGKVGFIF